MGDYLSYTEKGTRFCYERYEKEKVYMGIFENFNVIAYHSDSNCKRQT